PRAERRLLAFVLRRGRAPILAKLGSTKPIEEAVRAWRKPFETQPPGPVDGRAAAQLRRLVWQPVEKAVAGAGVVLLGPDGPLAGLPFVALPGSKPGTFLIEEIAIGRVPSGRSFVEQPGRKGESGKGLLALGGVDYGKPRRGRPAWPA